MSQYLTYKTVQGDTFDSISYKFYGDEFCSHYIISANLDYCTTLIFSEGIELKIPVLEIKASTSLPPWKR